MTNDYATKSDLTSLEQKLDIRFKKIDDRFDELMSVLSNFADDVNIKFLEHDEEFRILNTKYDHLINTIDDFISRITKQILQPATTRSLG